MNTGINILRGSSMNTSIDIYRGFKIANIHTSRHVSTTVYVYIHIGKYV